MKKFWFSLCTILYVQMHPSLNKVLHQQIGLIILNIGYWCLRFKLKCPLQWAMCYYQHYQLQANWWNILSFITATPHSHAVNTLQQWMHFHCHHNYWSVLQQSSRKITPVLINRLHTLQCADVDKLVKENLCSLV